MINMYNYTANKEHPSLDGCSLLAEDETRVLLAGVKRVYGWLLHGVHHLQPSLRPLPARATRKIGASRHYLAANKKHPSGDGCSLLAEDETRTRNNLLGRQGLYH